MKKSTLLLLTILLVAFNSCKKDDDIEPTIPTVQEGTALISATINDKEIGGSNLSVSSVYYPDAPIKDNSFKTIVSQKGTQVVFVLDENNSLRGLSYTKKSGNNYELVPIDAASTVISLFLLTPGITTTTSEETLELINNLESLSSYQKLKTEVQNNLSQNNLEQLLAKENINTLFEDVILEYIEKISSNSSTKSAKIDLYGNRLSVMKNKDGMVEISNQAFRRINVYRSYIDNNQVTDSKLLFKSMKGGVGVSWGSLFTFSSFEPTIKVDEEYLPPTQSAITEYWVIGPGNAESDEMPPSYINKDYDQALTETCIYYVLFPMIDLLNGTSKLIDKDGLVQDVFECTKEIRAGTSGLKYLDDMKNASSKKAFNTAMINYTVLIGKTAIAIPAIASSVGVSAGVAGTIGTCLAIISIPMSVANLSAFTADYFKQPKYSKFIIETQLNSPVLLSPTNSSNLQSTSVTFSWEKNPLAWKYVVEISKNSDFEDKIIRTTDGITTTLTLTLEPSTLYYWRVYCTKADGSPSENSEVWEFTTGADNGNSAPVANFSADTTSITEGGTVSFTDLSTNTPTGWSWDFGDGNTSTQQNPTNTYSTAGTYTVALTATNAYGSDTETKTNYIIVSTGGSGTVTDYDGNTYNTVQIGNQIWMAENLKVTHYPNGTAIPLVTDNTAWSNLGDNNTDDAYCYYNNSSTNADTYGALYTWAAAMGDNAVSSNANPSGVQGVCPDGWHLPSDAEWKQLEMYLGMSQAEADYTGGRGTDEGSKLKATSGWNSDGNGTNTSGFTALPGGYRYNYNGYFYYLGNYGGFWSATETIASHACTRYLYYNFSDVYRNYSNKSYGFSVRCLRD